TGLFSATRVDIGTFVTTVSGGYARDGSVFVNTEARTVEYPLGVFATPTSSGSMWTQEYQNINEAQQILAAIPKVTPAYTTAEAAAITGVVQTMMAYNYMLLAESHDTLGLAILPVGLTSSQQAPGVCMKDGWAYTIALLDSANAALTTAGSVVMPIKLPSGFAGVGATAGPSTAAGSFASFNRAMAAKANLELAYAIARTPTTAASAPTPNSAGAPNAAALTTAASDLAASAMYQPASLAPEPVAGFSPGPLVVTHDYSAQSGDIVNPINGEIGTLALLNDLIVSIDTVNDLRFKAKFKKNPNAVQENFYNAVASKYLPSFYPSPGSPIPIVREEQLVLWNAQILLAQGNFVGALALVNSIRTTVGGLAAYPASDATSGNPYVQVRNDLLKEQHTSTFFEASADRTIALRMYGLAAAADTTWGTNGPNEDPNVKGGDQHTTVNPIPFSELTGRNETAVFATTCK